jgi:hypothetical protein
MYGFQHANPHVRVWFLRFSLKPDSFSLNTYDSRFWRKCYRELSPLIITTLSLICLMTHRKGLEAWCQRWWIKWSWLESVCILNSLSSFSRWNTFVRDAATVSETEWNKVDVL